MGMYHISLCDKKTHRLLQVRQFVCQVNGQCVLHLDYRTVNRLVMTGPRTVVLEVLEPLQ